ncbi:hypothetical protein FRB94_006849 [Tulasnella sp. JGI-2019a]|nr:hypothetical protein FRB94_006849 [Tulasnella sp. JGI-2019a]
MRFIISEISIQTIQELDEAVHGTATGSLEPLLQEQAEIKAQGKCVMTVAILRYGAAFAQVVPVLVELGPELDRLTADPRWAIRLQESVIAGKLLL